jgi:hypothetical protein
MALLAMLAGLMELPRVPDGPALRDTYSRSRSAVSSSTIISWLP